MPAPGQRHGLAFHPHIAVPQRIVAQDVPAVWADLIVVTARDVDDATVDCTSVTVSKPAKHKQFLHVWSVNAVLTAQLSEIFLNQRGGVSSNLGSPAT